jgi:hypothetical protein
MASISAAIGIIGYVNLRAMRRADLALYECDTKPQPDLAHMSVSFQKIRVALRDFLASSSPEQKAKFSQQAIDLTVELDQAVKSLLNGISLVKSGRCSTSSCARGSYADFEARILAAGSSSQPQDGWEILRSDSYRAVAKTVLRSIAEIEHRYEKPRVCFVLEDREVWF